MTEQPAIVTAGGWCAPLDAIYDADLLQRNEFTTASMFPAISVSREWRQPTEAEVAAQQAFAQFAQRTAARLAEVRHATIEAAARVALAEGWDLHVYHPPEPYDLRRANEKDLLYLRQVGIAFTEQKFAGLPTIHEHLCPDWWDDDD